MPNVHPCLSLLDFQLLMQIDAFQFVFFGVIQAFLNHISRAYQDYPSWMHRFGINRGAPIDLLGD
jgi:hypothetical protein